MALRLIRSAKSRRDLIESTYHRLQFFDDPKDLPDWFVEDEEKHMRKQVEVPKVGTERGGACVCLRSIARVSSAEGWH